MKSQDLTRRELLQAGLAGAVTALAGEPLEAAVKGRPPNIVFIMADDLGYADVSCYGRTDYRTPSIDQMAARGVRFVQGYANSAVCSATRTALATGRYQYRLRVGLEEPIGRSAPDIGLPPEHPTLASLLKRAGYRTALVGKWHLGALPHFGPLQSGYERFYGFRGGGIDYFSHLGVNRKRDLWNDDVEAVDEGYATELFGRRAVSWIEEYARSSAPFFLSLHFNAPHWPWEGPGDAAESRRLQGTLRSFDSGSQAVYAQMVVAMDAAIGRVLKALDTHGLAENTLVIFTSDNGGERFSNTWPFSGQKTELLEGGLRVPAIVSWPARIPQGVISQQVMITMDWVATLLAAAGVEPDPKFPLDGMDLRAHLLEQAAPVPRKLYWRYKAHHQRALRDGDFKYLKILGNTFLFNVAEDPLERANLKDRRRDIYDRLEADWRAWNATMLPELDDTFTEGVSGSMQADHFGISSTLQKADDGS
jgi:arylsulfatase A-like enzyme